MIFILGAAQTEITSGVVNYSETVKMNIKLEGESSQFAAMLPKERTSQKILYFSPDASLYQLNTEKQEDETISQDIGGASIMVKMVQPDNKFYADLKGKKTIKQRDFMTRIFLIEQEMKSEGWKLTGNQKSILDYPCQEAVKMEDTTKIIAWFTPAIPVASGPGKYIDLPGLVLAVDVNNGERMITATSVDLEPVDKAILKKPKKGKKVSQNEFDKIVEEKNKEMEEQYGSSGGGVVIKIH